MVSQSSIIYKIIVCEDMNIKDLYKNFDKRITINYGIFFVLGINNQKKYTAFDTYISWSIKV